MTARVWIVVVLTGCDALFSLTQVPGPIDGQQVDSTSCVRPTQVEGSVFHACVRLDDGTAWCWGANDEGQLGRARLPGENSSTPVLVSSGQGPVTGIEEIGTGSFFTCARRTDGTVSCWGSNFSAQLGANLPAGAGMRSLDPVTVLTANGPLTDVTDIDVGYYHACAVSTNPTNGNDTVYCWGENSSCQLGESSAAPSPIAIPVTLASPNVLALSAGGDMTCAVVDNGLPEAYCWGRQQEGRLANGQFAAACVATPQRVAWDNMLTPLPAPRDIECGGSHVCAIKRPAGEAYCWGRNNTGKLGDGSLLASAVAVRVGLPDGDLRFVGAGDVHSCAAYGDDTFCWGDDVDGRVGNGPPDMQELTPVRVIAGDRLDDLSVGYDFTCALGESGRIRCWGTNNEGQLGVGDFAPRDTPTDIAPLPVMSCE